MLSMQTELFKKNAIILLSDDNQQLLYKDILSANGFVVKLAGSVGELVKSINRDTNLVMICADSVDNESTQLITAAIAKQPFKIAFIGLTVSNEKRDDIQTLRLPMVIDRFLDEIMRLSDQQSEDECLSMM